jgi:hypothetical protein
VRYFNDNLHKFQNTGRLDEADNYSFINFFAVAKSWNEWVVSLKSEKPHVTFKTTSKLKEAFNQSKNRANQKATLWPHKAQLNDLQSTHRDPTTNRSFLPGFATPKEPSLYQHLRTHQHRLMFLHLEKTMNP